MTERVALITGASAGIGAELARVFASNGHRVALVARRADRLAALAGEITASGGAAPIATHPAQAARKPRRCMPAPPLHSRSRYDASAHRRAATLHSASSMLLMSQLL